MEIYIKGDYTPLGDVKIQVYQDLSNEINYKGNRILFPMESVNQTPTGIITAIKTIELPVEALSYLKDENSELPRDNNVESHFENQYIEVQDILRYLKTFNAIYELDENLRMHVTYFWSLDCSDWKPLPDKRLTAWRPINPFYTLPENFIENIEAFLNQEIPVFFAFTHLQKAFQEKNTRYKWINATIAAEHAFKEFLILKDSKTENLMLNIPSPRIEILYKHVLKDYTEKESSMYKHLQDGSSIRNQLVHKPNIPNPDSYKTEVYLHQVEVAIFELYTLLYPDNKFLNYSLERAKFRLNRVIDKKKPS